MECRANKAGLQRDSILNRNTLQPMRNALMWLHGVFLIYPTTYPVMLAGLHYAKSCLDGFPVTWACASMLTISASYGHMSFLMGAMCGVISTSIISHEPRWYAGWAVCVATLIGWNYLLFARRKQQEKTIANTSYKPVQIDSPGL